MAAMTIMNVHTANGRTAVPCEYDKLTPGMKRDLIADDPERALRYINVYGDTEMAQAYVDAHPTMPSTYHLANKMGLLIRGEPVILKGDRFDPSEPAWVSAPTVDEDLKTLRLAIRAAVARVNPLGYVHGAAVRHYPEEESSLWENVVRAYEDNRWEIGERPKVGKR